MVPQNLSMIRTRRIGRPLVGDQRRHSLLIQKDLRCRLIGQNVAITSTTTVIMIIETREILTEDRLLAVGETSIVDEHCVRIASGRAAASAQHEAR
jgi:hypothetical protein